MKKKEITIPYIQDVDIPGERASDIGTRGISAFNQIKNWKVGSGDKSIRAEVEQGFWLGNAQFSNAPFRVDMSGNAVANSITITGGTIDDTTTIDGKSAGGFSTVVDDGATPANPTGLTATAGVQGVFLKWTYNTETDMSHYEIWRNTTDDNSTASKIGQVKTNLFWDSDLTSGTTYYYWIKAVDHLGNTSGFNATAGTSATPRNVGTSDIQDSVITNDKIDVSNFMSVPSDEDLVAYWSFDEGSGTQVKDTSKNTNDGTLEPNSGTITDETFTSSFDVAVQLNHTNLDSGSVVVTTTDGETTYTEGTDYTIDYTAGTITVLSSGSMSDATDYYIDYTYSGSYPTFVDGVSGKALSFDGVDDYVQFSSITMSKEGATLSWWINAEEDSITNGFYLFTNTLSDSAFSHILINFGSYKVFVETNTNCNGPVWTSVPSLTSGWHYYVIVFDNSKAYLYIDGVSYGEPDSYQSTACTGGETAYSLINDLTLSVLGGHGTYVPRFNGTIDEVRIYNKALSAKEVQALYLYINPNAKNVITAHRIAANTITASEIAAGTITTNEIAANTITAGNIATSTITANEMNVSQLAAISADLGDITAGTITLPTTGWIKGGQTAYNTGTGFFLGYDTDAYKFSVGNPSGYHINFDGTYIDITARNMNSGNTLEQDAGVGYSWFKASASSLDIGKRTSVGYSSCLEYNYNPSAGEYYFRIVPFDSYTALGIETVSTDFGNFLLKLSLPDAAAGIPLYIENSGTRGDIQLPNRTSDPSSGTVGALAVVSGVLKICTSTSPLTWTVVGSQT